MHELIASPFLDDYRRVLTLPERPLTAPALPTDERPLPTVTPYDQLLRGERGKPWEASYEHG